jgi:YHS domain-containing protein
MSRIKKLNVRLWKIKRRMKDVIERERAICGLIGGKWFYFAHLKKEELFKLNPWIEYISTHTTLSYAETINLYDKCTSLPIKLTRRKARMLTKLIIEQTAAGVAWMIDPAMLVATMEVERR